MQLRKLDRGELIAVIGGAVLGLSLAFEWYSLGNKYAILNGCKGPRGSCTGWASLSILRFVFLAAALAPAILAYIVARGHALSWPRGELTAIIALVALVFVVFRGIIDKPGQPPAEISVDYGWFLALAGGLLILVGSVWRSRETAERRKPPGVL